MIVLIECRNTKIIPVVSPYMSFLYIMGTIQSGTIVSRDHFVRAILGLRPANERRRYNITSSLLGWACAHNDPCIRRHTIILHPWPHWLGQYVNHRLMKERLSCGDFREIDCVIMTLHCMPFVHIKIEYLRSRFSGETGGVVATVLSDMAMSCQDPMQDQKTCSWTPGYQTVVIIKTKCILRRLFH